MKLIRSFSIHVLRSVAHRARPAACEWGLAVLREMDFIESDWQAILWALGGVKSVLSHREGVMRGQQINRVSQKIVVTLSLIALVMVVSGYFQRPEPDEGAAAHIFQISIALVIPAIMVFLATANWKRPLQSARPLVLPAAALALAFGALYYLEHYFYVQHYR